MRAIAVLFMAVIGADIAARPAWTEDSAANDCASFVIDTIATFVLGVPK